MGSIQMSENNTQKLRKHHSIESRERILRRHLIDKISVADLSQEYNVQPSSIYTWLQQLYANIGAALQNQAKPRQDLKRESELERKIETLEAKIAKKDSVIAEISSEFIELKKELGDL